MLQLTLFDANTDLCKEFGRAFSPYRNVTVKNVLLDDLDSHDLLVTAGNSYGLMGGGIDYYVNKMCKFKAEPLVREQIDNYWGELPIGKFVTVDIDKLTKSKFKVLVYAPTMKKPSMIPPDNVYKCFKSIIDTYKNTDYTLACPRTWLINWWYSIRCCS